MKAWDVEVQLTMYADNEEDAVDQVEDMMDMLRSTDKSWDVHAAIYICRDEAEGWTTGSVEEG